MYRRLGAIMLALVIVGAPGALTACEIVCARHHGHSPSGAQPAAHSCHGMGTSEAPAIRGGMHICGHDDELPAAAAQTMLLLAPPSAVVVAVQTLIVHEDGAIHRAHALTSSPPGSTLSVPLRI